MIATSDGFHLGHEWHPQCRDGSIAVGRLSHQVKLPFHRHLKIGSQVSVSLGETLTLTNRRNVPETSKT